MQLPLFPLSSVLFPGGVLPLRVFEARYMDMVRDCMKKNTNFGVCLISKGREVGGGVKTFDVGCVASIRSWDMPQLGVLQLRTVGLQRFHIASTRTESNGLMLGEVELLESDDDAPIAPEHRACVDLLKRIIEDVQTQLAELKRDAPPDDPSQIMNGLPFEPPFVFESSAWVSNRLCEVLQVPMKAKQKLMELNDAHTRLEIVHTYLKQHSVLK